MKKALLITLCILFRFAISIPNYANPGGAGDWTLYDKCKAPPTGYFKSPILVKDSLCMNYESFTLAMEDDNAGGTFESKVEISGSFGAPKRAYFGGNITINGRFYSSSEYHVRTKSEHVLFTNGTPADAEIQILFWTAAENVVLSFLIREIPDDSTAPIYTSSPYAKLMSSITATNWQLNFKELAQRITQHQKYNVFLNMYTYAGTLTYQNCELANWFIFGQELYATKEVLDIIRDYTATVTNAANDDGNHNARPYTGPGGGGGELAVTRLCYQGANFMTNFKVFPGLLLMFVFFLFNVFVF